MNLNLTLVSDKRALIISNISIALFGFLFFYSFTLRDIFHYLSILIIILGVIQTYFLLKYFSRFNATVEINKEYIKVGDRFTLHWDDIKRYEYSNTGLLAGLIFRTKDKTYTIIGLTRGPEAKKFILIKDYVFEILQERESSGIKNRILPYNFYETKLGQIGGYIIVAVCLFGIITSLYLIISRHKITSYSVLGLITFSFAGLIHLLILSKSRKQKDNFN